MATYDYVNSTGVIVPDTSTMQSDVEGEFQTAFGSDLVVTADTPQGVLITGEVAARTNVLANNALVANQINPNLASGVFLDALCALMGIVRKAATFTLVQNVVLTGNPTTAVAVPAGSLAKTINGDVFATNFAVIIPIAGTALVDFTAQQSGVIPCDVDNLNTMVTQILGLTAVLNPEAADFIGSDVQSDQSLRTQRNQQLYLYGKSSPEAQISSLYDVPGVLGVQFLENVTSAPATISTITLAAHSIWACVDGGTDAAIGWSLLSNKSDGAGWNGAHTVTVVDPASGQSYTVLFDRPVDVPLLTTVTVAPGTFTGDPQVSVRNALSDYATGKINGMAGFMLGADVSPFEMAAAVISECPGIIVLNVQVGTVAGGVVTPATIELNINQKASLQQSNMSVVVTT